MTVDIMPIISPEQRTAILGGNVAELFQIDVAALSGMSNDGAERLS